VRAFMIDKRRGLVSERLLLMIVTLILTGCSEGTINETESRDIQGEDMAQLSIFLLDGFENDAVVLKLKDEEVFRKENITYSPLLGFADDSFKADVEKGIVTLEVILETRDTTDIYSFEILEDMNLGISIENGEIQFIPLPDDVGFG
jgi:hypothetical protein